LPSKGQPQALAPDVPSKVLKQADSATRSDSNSTPAQPDRVPVIPDKEFDTPDLNVSAPLPARNSSLADVPKLGKTSDQADTSQPDKAPDQLDTQQRTRTLSESPDGSGKEARLGEKALSGDSLLKKLDPTRLEVATSPTQGRAGAASNGKSAPAFEPPVPNSDPAVPQADRPSATAQPPKASTSSPFANTSASIGEQIRESITSSMGRPEQQITIRLNPPELGKVVVRFQEQDSHITGLLEVSKPQTRAEIQYALPQMLRNLQDSGVQIRRLEVVVTNEQPRQTMQDDSAAPQQGSLLFHQNQSGPQGPPPGRTVNELLAETDPYRGFAAQDNVFVADESIDMLA
jgi:flagellar hook-length control protein FliK